MVVQGDVTRTGKRRKAASGRKTLITKEIIEAVIFSLKAGCYIETAAAYAGISKNTLYDWLKRGRRERRRLSKNPRAKPFASEVQFVIFLSGVTRAMSESEVRDVSLIAQAANGGQKYVEERVSTDAQGNIIEKTVVTKTMSPQWQAAAWRLERKHPKKWGRRVAIRKDEGNGEETPESFANKVREELGDFFGAFVAGEAKEPIVDAASGGLPDKPAQTDA